MPTSRVGKEWIATWTKTRQQLYMLTTNYISLYQEGFTKYWDQPAFSNYEGKTYTYAELAEHIAHWHLFFEQSGIKRGDKIALMGKDTAEWVIVFLASITYGAVIVPVLQDFAPQDAMGIIDHSEAKLLFISDNLWEAMLPDQLPRLERVVELQSGSALYATSGLESLTSELVGLPEAFAIRYPKGYVPEDVAYYQTPNEEVLLLNYTSGTTGFSKGVMVTGNNMAGNVLWCREKDIVRPGMRLLSFLPLAHTYGCMINVLLAATCGVHVTLLGRTPSPNILGPALRKVRPNIVITVPLVLEKIYQSSIMPILQQSKIKWMLRLPVLRRVVHKKIREKLLEGMGGEAHLVIAGGAALNAEVGAFLKRIGFPISVGYGMTECAPLISFTPDANTWRTGSCGQPLEGYMQARITPVEDESGQVVPRKDEAGRLVGEIQVRGENVCKGYYKNEEQTRLLFTEDGWLRTGDLGSMDEQGFIYIKGRSKTMLLGPNGQNIYPEEIEAKISLLPYVQESVVVMRSGKLEAILVLNKQAIEQAGISEQEAWEEVCAQRGHLNSQLGSYEKIQRFEQRLEPFEKTPKQSIKRFLYN